MARAGKIFRFALLSEDRQKKRTKNITSGGVIVSKQQKTFNFRMKHLLEKLVSYLSYFLLE